MYLKSWEGIVSVLRVFRYSGICRKVEYYSSPVNISSILDNVARNRNTNPFILLEIIPKVLLTRRISAFCMLIRGWKNLREYAS